MKKFICFLLFGLLAAGVQAVDSANASARQGPLTQHDIDAYYAIAPRLVDIFVGGHHQMITEAQEIFESAGWDEQRFFHVLMKIHAFRALNMDDPVDEILKGFEHFPVDHPLRATREEVTLAKRNLKTGGQIINELQTRCKLYLYTWKGELISGEPMPAWPPQQF